MSDTLWTVWILAFCTLMLAGAVFLLYAMGRWPGNEWLRLYASIFLTIAAVFCGIVAIHAWVTDGDLVSTTWNVGMAVWCLYLAESIFDDWNRRRRRRRRRAWGRLARRLSRLVLEP